MIDYFKAKTEISLPLEMRNQEFKPIEFLELIFYPEIFSGGKLVCYKSTLKNLRLRIIGSTLYIENSLWKFYHGNNYLPFTYQELIKAIIQLEHELGLNSDTLEVIKLEYGMVVYTDEVDIHFKDFGKYKLYQPYNMTKSGRVYGKYYLNTSMKIKIYDKKFEARREGHHLSNELLRIEKRCNLKMLVKTKNFEGVRANYLSDFSKKGVVEALYNDLISSLRKIEINDDALYSELSPKEIRVIGYFDNEHAREKMKRNHLSTYKRDRLVFEGVKKQSTNKKYIEFIELLENQRTIIF